MILVPALKIAARWLRRKVWDRWQAKADPQPASTSRQTSLETGDLAAYQELIRARNPSVEVVDDATWADLEMDKVLARLDGAATPLGAQ